MQDIDFDELDRAVSSLISATPATKTDDGAVAPVESIANVSFNNTPVEATPVSTPAPIFTPTPVLVPEPSPVNVTAAAPVAPAPSTLVQNRPNLGRAMDFVRTPSDSKMSTPITPAVPAIPRRSMVINPISTTEFPSTASVVESPVAAQSPVINNIPIGGSVTDSTMPQNESSESPFITDAKVEKRPLGAFSEGASNETATDNSAMPAYSATITTGNDVVANTTDDYEISTDMPFPAELQNSLLEIESSDTAALPVQPAVSAEMPIPDKPIITESIAAVQPEVAAPSVVDVKMAATQPTVTAQQIANPTLTNSIPQQYPTNTDMAAQKTGAIFDTSVYHNGANIKPPKKSNAWIWILAIVLILIGAAVGVGLYFFIK